MWSRSSCEKLPQHGLDAVTRAGALRRDRHALEHAHAALVEQPIDQPLARQRWIEQLEVLDGLDHGAAFDPGVVLGDDMGGRAFRRVAGMEVGHPRALRRLGQELQQHAAGPPAVAGAGRHLLADREPHPGRDLLRAFEVFVRGVLQAAAVERDQALVAARVGALVDGHGEMAAGPAARRRRPCRPRSRRPPARRRNARRRARARGCGNPPPACGPDRRSGSAG